MAVLDDLLEDGPALCGKRLYTDVDDDEQVLLLYLDMALEVELSSHQRSDGTSK